MVYLSKPSFSLLQSKSSMSLSSKTLSSYISLTTSIYLSSLSYQLWILLCKKDINFSNLSFQYSRVFCIYFILDFKNDISLSFSLIVLFKDLTFIPSASLFSGRVLILLFLSFNCSWALTSVLDRVCILSYSLLVLSTWLIKSIKESLSSFDKI